MSEAGLNLCAGGGSLVGTRWPVPEDDPGDFQVDGLGFVVGCTRLRCPECGERVRSKAGFWPDVAAAGRYGELFQTPDWSTLDYLVHTPDSRNARLYTCRCGFQTEWERKVLGDPEGDRVGSPALPWRCEGHPPLTLPATLDGVPLKGDLQIVLKQGLLSTGPAGAPPTVLEVPAGWVSRLYHRVSGLPLQEEISLRIAAMVSTPDPRLRAAIVRFFLGTPTAAGLDLVFNDARKVRERYIGVRDPWGRGGRDLEGTLGLVAARRLDVDPTDAPTLAFARSELLRSGAEGPLYERMRELDPAWVGRFLGR